ncbi:MAG: ATP-binding protein [Eubacteriales bacterium]|nr:ATP-binding protein [Eubacteriales bacterium]
MMRTFAYVAVIIMVYLNPFLPASLKGLLGVIFIIVSSIETNLKGSLLTAFLIEILMMINCIFDNNVDFKYEMIHMVMGTIVYLLVALYIGKAADKLRRRNKELQTEIEMRKNIEQDMKENLSILESITSTLPTPVCYKDLTYRFTGCNSAYEEYFGLGETDIRGKCAHDLFDPEVADPCLEMDIDLLEHKIRQSRELSFVSQEGERKYFIFTKALLTDKDGEPSGIVCVFVDTTEQKQHEWLKKSMEEEKRIMDEMQKYDKLKTEFFSNISHELRTPLNVIFCAVQMMEMNLNDEVNPICQTLVKKNVLSIRQNSLRLLRLVNNLIDITKIDAQAFEINLHNSDLVCAVKEIIFSVADYVTTKGLKLVFHSDVKEKIMAFDEEKIERIMLNLISNAIKFSPIGENIYVNILGSGDHVCIQVKDMGIGIPANHMKYIFQRFYQISPVNTRLREGSGIGLSIVKSLVEMHQGTITVDSEYGKGTTFIIELPTILLPAEAADKEELINRQARIENIQLELSDIYLTNR